MDAKTASERLQIGRSQLYNLRTKWLRADRKLDLIPSGGPRSEGWPAHVLNFMRDFLPRSHPPNFALLADEIARRFGFQRSRAAVANAARLHFPHIVSTPRRGPKPRRRWQCAAIGELFQHDSSPHRWWKAEKM
jgi:hypothetical protein